MRSLALVLATLLSTPLWAEPVDVNGAWVREPIPGRAMSAAFMQLNNPGSADKVLVSAKAEWAGNIEIHTHTNDNGVMRMREIESVIVPAGGSVSLQPGGLHLMLFNLQLPLNAPLELELCFADGECQTVTADIRGMEGPGMGPGKGGQHRGH